MSEPKIPITNGSDHLIEQIDSELLMKLLDALIEEQALPKE